MTLRLVTLALLLAGCAGDPLGDPCAPERVPAGGFDPGETYVETGSADCASDVCIVRGLEGDPRPDCASGCASEESVSAHVYCSCRCDQQGLAPPCACSEGYRCEPLGSIGSYCVRD